MADMVGAEVAITGLQGRPELNGQRGFAMSFDAQRGRVRVKLPPELDSECVGLKPENLINVMCAVSAKKPSWADRDLDIIARACDVARNAADPCGDGDQSPIHIAPGTPGNALEQMWARGSDLYPWQPMCAEILRGNNPWIHDEAGGKPERAMMLYSRFFVACAWGQLQLVRLLLAEARSETDRARLLELRESNLRYAPLHVCIAGARVQPGGPTWQLPPGTPSPDHVEVARMLLEAGARPDAKDICGHTCLMLACGTHATSKTLQIARLLGAHGASMRAVSRLGFPLLQVAAAEPGERCDVVKILLELGADPEQRAETLMPECNAISIRRMLEMHKRTQTLALFDAHARRSRKGAGGSSTPETTTSTAGAVPASPNDLGVPEREARGKMAQLGLTGCVTVHGVVSKPELNDEVARVLRFKDGRYECRFDDGCCVRLKAENVRAYNTRMTAVEFDPDELRPWPGLPAGALDGRKKSALGFCFENAMPVCARSKMSHGVPESELLPWTQWLSTLGEFAESWAEGKKGQRVWRYHLEDAEQREALTIDVLRAPLDCPAHVPAHATGLPNGEAAPSEPLLLVRYLYVCKEKEADLAAGLQTFQRAVPGECEVADAAVRAIGCSPQSMRFPAGIAKGRATSTAEVRTALTNLQANEAALCATYRSAFYEGSPLHHEERGGFFRCSFLVPPHDEPRDRRPPRACAGCGREAGTEERFQFCAKCSAVCYCSRECQVAHWPMHKKICSKSAAKLQAKDAAAEAEAGGGGGGQQRRSVVMSLLPPEHMRGKVQCNLPMNGAPMPRLDKLKTLDPSVAPKNEHGDREFAVKVQTPPPMDPSMGCMVYDERRTFQAFMPMDTPGIRPLLKLIYDHGPGGGRKGYFTARREGSNLRIFSAEMLPPPAW